MFISKKLYLAYTIDKNAEDYLYYAASSSVNAGDWETALKFYIELKELNYEGIITKYYVTKIDTGEKLEVDEVQYELFKKLPKWKNKSGLLERYMNRNEARKKDMSS